MDVRVVGGCIALVWSLYPHNVKPLNERMEFCEASERHQAGVKLVLGDLNARISQRRPGGDDLFGGNRFGREVPNRDLLMYFCISWVG